MGRVRIKKRECIQQSTMLLFFKKSAPAYVVAVRECHMSALLFCCTTCLSAAHVTCLCKGVMHHAAVAGAAVRQRRGPGSHRCCRCRSHQPSAPAAPLPTPSCPVMLLQLNSRSSGCGQESGVNGMSVGGGHACGRRSNCSIARQALSCSPPPKDSSALHVTPVHRTLPARGLPPATTHLHRRRRARFAAAQEPLIAADGIAHGAGHLEVVGFQVVYLQAGGVKCSRWVQVGAGDTRDAWAVRRRQKRDHCPGCPALLCCC